jgi:DNA adenine methylase
LVPAVYQDTVTWYYDGMENGSPLKPFLKWAGGKRQLLPEIKKYIPGDIHTYYEPFVGAGALFFDVLPKRGIINDFNTQLILTYRAIKENVEELLVVLEDYKARNSKEFFLKIRNTDREADIFNNLTTVEKAARLIYLNKTCFNGLYRVNSRGFFNVPYGRYKNPAIYEEAVLRRISCYLKTNEIDILNTDFENACLDADKNSFIYFDPPYHGGKTGFTGYQAQGFGEAEQERLRNVMVTMTKRGVKCLLSSSDTAYIRGLYNYDFFDIISVQAKRPINSNAADRGYVNEVLIKNWKG